MGGICRTLGREVKGLQSFRGNFEVQLDQLEYLGAVGKIKLKLN
jgi:hypothetical protein